MLWDSPKPGEYTPRLTRIYWPALLSFLVTGLVTGWTYRFMTRQPFHILPLPIASPNLKPGEALKSTAGIFALVAAVLTAVYAYRKQRLAEGESRRADAVEFSRRYGEALTQLGDDKAAVRLGGAHAMARLADDWDDQRQTCIDVLCAYLRMPFEQDPSSPKFKDGENEVRDTIQRIIESRVTAQADNWQPSWSAYNFDLTAAHLHNARFNGATFTGHACFDGATFFRDAGFNKATFTGGASFYNARFTGHARFDLATFSRDAGFDLATFFRDAGFNKATFTGEAGFNEATFAGGASFYNARFTGNTSFDNSSFTGERRSDVDPRFVGTSFAARASPRRQLHNARFTGNTRFDNARYRGRQV
jgi:hypothetical protein